MKIQIENILIPKRNKRQMNVIYVFQYNIAGLFVSTNWHQSNFNKKFHNSPNAIGIWRRKENKEILPPWHVDFTNIIKQ